MLCSTYLGPLEKLLVGLDKGLLESIWRRHALVEVVGEEREQAFLRGSGDRNFSAVKGDSHHADRRAIRIMFWPFTPKTLILN